MASIEKREGKNGTSYRALIRIKGHPAESASFKRLTDAKEWARNTESAIKERRYFKTAESRKHTFEDLAKRYISRVEKDNPKRASEIRSQMKFWITEMGYCVLADLNKALIAEKIEKLSSRERKLKDGTIKKISSARVNRYIAALSHACSIAVNEWEWLEQHPVKKISRRPEMRGRTRFLEDDERTRLLAACKESNNKALYTIVVLALSTGARRGEIMNLSWKDIDFDRQVIILHDTKNKERRVLPLTGHAYDLLKSHSKVRRLDTTLVFPAKQSKSKPMHFEKAWQGALQNAGIEDFRFHDLRHSAASYLAMNGATLAEIAEVLGHKTLQMVKRYMVLNTRHKACQAQTEPLKESGGL